MDLAASICAGVTGGRRTQSSSCPSMAVHTQYVCRLAPLEDGSGGIAAAPPTRGLTAVAAGFGCVSIHSINKILYTMLNQTNK